MTDAHQVRIAQARGEADAAKARLMGTVDEAKARLAPKTLAGHAVQAAKDKSIVLADDAVTKVKERPGLTAGIFGIGYGLSRIAVEFVRLPDSQLGYLLGTTWLTMGMVLSIPLVLAGLGLVIWAATRKASLVRG